MSKDIDTIDEIANKWLESHEEDMEIPVVHRFGKVIFSAVVAAGAAILAEHLYDKFRDRNNEEDEPTTQEDEG